MGGKKARHVPLSPYCPSRRTKAERDGTLDRAVQQHRKGKVFLELERPLRESRVSHQSWISQKIGRKDEAAMVGVAT